MMPENTDNIAANTIPRLVSAARREFLNRQSYSPVQVEAMEEIGTPLSKDEWSGPQMQAMTDLFRIIGSELHGTGFVWSEYNKATWIEYADLRESSSGSAMFSLEQSGNHDEKSMGSSFKGLFLGGPLGYYPYELGPGLDQTLEKRFEEIILAKTKYKPSPL
jgi:hypothetical protein